MKPMQPACLSLVAIFQRLAGASLLCREGCYLSAELLLRIAFVWKRHGSSYLHKNIRHVKGQLPTRCDIGPSPPKRYTLSK